MSENERLRSTGRRFAPTFVLRRFRRASGFPVFQRAFGTTSDGSYGRAVFCDAALWTARFSGNLATRSALERRSPGTVGGNPASARAGPSRGLGQRTGLDERNADNQQRPRPGSRAAKARRAACRNHHGRQWPLGRGPRPAALRRPPPRSRGLAPGRARREDLGVRYLTVYSFSSENWARPPQEIAELMGLLKFFIRNDLPRCGIRRAGPGHRRTRQSPARYRYLLDEAEQRTRRNDQARPDRRLQLRRAAEIVEAARSLARDVAAGRLRPEDIDEAGFAARTSYAPGRRSRPHHPHLGRNAPLEFPDVAIRL